MKFIRSIQYRWELYKIKHRDTVDETLKRQWYKKYYNISIGKYTYGYNADNIAQGTKIGAFCSIASGVKIGLMNHPMGYVSTHPFLYYPSRGFVKREINEEFEVGAEIGNDVWIGNNAIILAGVHIGNGAVVGAGAVVTKDVFPYEVVGGVPAKHLKWRVNDPELRQKLNSIKWWDWSDDKIKDNLNLFYDLKMFVDTFFENSLCK
mgnify:CR=1 FL=1